MAGSMAEIASEIRNGGRPALERTLGGRHLFVTRGIGETLARFRLQDGNKGAESKVIAVFGALFGSEQACAAALRQVIDACLQLAVGFQGQQPAGGFRRQAMIILSP